MGSCEIRDLRKLLFGVAQAHMKAKDWTNRRRIADGKPPHSSPYHRRCPTLQDTNEAIETLDKTIGLAQAAGDMQDIWGFDL